MARRKKVAVPEVGGEAPEFNLPSAQGGQLRLSMRTARGPVVVVFYEGPIDEEVAYFESLAAKEDEINMAGGSVVGIGISEPDEAREFVKQTGIKSYVLYDYARIATREYGLLEKTRGRGEHTRPATFVVDGDHNVAGAWVGERPNAEEVLAKVSEITGLPKKEEPAEESEGEEKPKRAARKKAESTGEDDGAKAEGETGAEAGSAKRERPSPEEREKRRAERRAAREEDGKGDAGAEAGAGADASESPDAGSGAEASAKDAGQDTAGEKAGGESEGESKKAE